MNASVTGNSTLIQSLSKVEHFVLLVFSRAVVNSIAL